MKIIKYIILLLFLVGVIGVFSYLAIAFKDISYYSLMELDYSYGQLLHTSLSCSITLLALFFSSMVYLFTVLKPSIKNIDDKLVNSVIYNMAEFAYPMSFVVLMMFVYCVSIPVILILFNGISLLSILFINVSAIVTIILCQIFQRSTGSIKVFWTLHKDEKHKKIVLYIIYILIETIPIILNVMFLLIISKRYKVSNPYILIFAIYYILMLVIVYFLIQNTSLIFVFLIEYDNYASEIGELNSLMNRAIKIVSQNTKDYDFIKEVSGTWKPFLLRTNRIVDKNEKVSNIKYKELENIIKKLSKL